MRSDTLFGAICWCKRAVSGSTGLEEILDRFAAGDPPFALGNAYPCQADTMYWPMPKLGFPLTSPSTDSSVDALPKANYIEHHLFAQILAGTLRPADLQTLVAEGTARVVERSVATTASVPAVKTQYVWRAAGNRLTGGAQEGQLYSVPLIRYGAENLAHIPCSVAVDFQDELTGLLKLLGDTGVGADRSVGLGHFEMIDSVETAFEVPDPNATIALGHLTPATEEFNYNQEPLSYGINLSEPLYDSFVAHDRVPKGRIRSFEPGSILPGAPSKPWAGRLLPTPHHAIPKAVHCGICSVLPARIHPEDV